jgi:hypothetical protein
MESPDVRDALGKTASVSVYNLRYGLLYVQFDRQTADAASSAARAEEAEVLEGFRR